MLRRSRTRQRIRRQVKRGFREVKDLNCKLCKQIVGAHLVLAKSQINAHYNAAIEGNIVERERGFVEKYSSAWPRCCCYD